MTESPTVTHPTADLCDAYDATLQVVETNLFDFGGHTRFAGKLRTLQLFEDNSLVRQLLEGPGEGAVLVVDGGGSRRCALLGGRLATLAHTHGWAGVVIWGCVRDTEVLRQMPLGVKALGPCPRKSIKRNTGQVDVPVRFGGVTFSPGHHLYADTDGIVVAPSALALQAVC